MYALLRLLLYLQMLYIRITCWLLGIHKFKYRFFFHSVEIKDAIYNLSNKSQSLRMLTAFQYVWSLHGLKFKRTPYKVGLSSIFKISIYFQSDKSRNINFDRKFIFHIRKARNFMLNKLVWTFVFFFSFFFFVRIVHWNSAIITHVLFYDFLHRVDVVSNSESEQSPKMVTEAEQNESVMFIQK